MKWFCFLLTFSVSFGLFAQLDEELDSSGSILKMNNTLNLRFDLDNDVRSFEFNSLQDTYSILPNTRLRMAVAYNYRFLSFKIGFSPKFLSSGSTEEKGSTSIFRFSLDIFMNDIYQNIDFDRTSGYYVDGFDGIIPIDNLLGNNLLSNEEFIILPNMTSISFTGTTVYRFNENYSFKALVNQTEIQTKSAGSFIPGLYYGFWQIRDKSGPQDIDNYFIIATAGYAYTFVLGKNWYANLGLSPGLGIEYNKVTTRVQDAQSVEYSTGTVFNINTQIGLGYNTRRLYAGTTLVGNAVTRGENSLINFDNVRGYFKVYIGYRFDPPKGLISAMDWVEDRNPFRKKNK